MTASDGTLQHVKTLMIYITDVNEKPFFTSATRSDDILENETSSRVVIAMDASDVDDDVLTYTIQGSTPADAPFIIDSSNGNENESIIYQLNIHQY